MARIPEEEIERLKREISLERLAEAKGVKLKKHGENLLGLCPFHEDRSPSLVITPKKNLWHCLGACQAGGSVIDWVMRAEGVSYRHALELLKADLPSLEAFSATKHGRQAGPVAKKTTRAKLPVLGERSASEEVLLREVVDYYHATLKESPEALEYLEKRGLRSSEMVERFRLGYANRTLGYRLPQKNRLAGAELRGELVRLGVYRENGREHLRGSLVIPIFDEQGRVTEMYGRKLNDHLRPGTPLHLYLPGPHRGVWNEEAFRASKEIILCESLIDALTFWCAGYRHVTASYGVEGFTEDHRAALRRYGTERVLVAYDRDEAGDRAADKLGPELAGMGIEVLRVLFPKGMDANEYALKVKPATQSLGLVLRQAQWMAGVRRGGAVGALARATPATIDVETTANEMTSGAEAEAPSEERESAVTGDAVLGEPSFLAAEALVEPEADEPAPAAEASAAEPAAEPERVAESLTEPARQEATAEPEPIAEPAREDATAEGEPTPEPIAEPAREEAAEAPSSAAAEEAPSPPPIAAERASSPARRPRMTANEARRAAEELGAELAENVPSLPSRAPSTSAPTPPPTPSATAGGELSFVFGDRRYRVRGLPEKALPGSLRVNVLCTREGGAFHVDTLELYSARQRAHFLKLASDELGVEERVVKRDLGEVLLKLEEFLEERQRVSAEGQKPRELSDSETREALELLRDPKLLERILGDFERCGVVGESTNKLVGYLAATSRKLEQPLAVVIQSSSAAGKSSLMEAVLELMPEEERVQYSAMTGQSLFYMGETNLKHKILGIVEEQGAERASYALKLLQSEGELTIASTGKDPATGRLVTEEYHVEGPVMLFQTTTSADMDEELLNRCIVLTVDEGREQTRAIHERQRQARTLEGVIARKERERLIKLHQNAQRLIRPLFVVNPYASELGFPDHQTRMRRDHVKYLGLIEAVALLHQYQRAVKVVEHRGETLRYIEATKEDIAVANRLAHEVLGRTLDELPPQTRRLLGLLDEMVTAESERLGLDRGDYRFSRREVRERTGFGDTQLKVHLGRLLELEYVLGHRASGHSQRLFYELVYTRGSGSGPFLPGLIGADELGRERGEANRSGCLVNRSGQNEDRSGSGRPLVGGRSGARRGAEGATFQQENRPNADAAPASAEKPRRGNGATTRVVAVAPSAARAVS